MEVESFLSWGKEVKVGVWRYPQQMAWPSAEATTLGLCLAKSAGTQSVRMANAGVLIYASTRAVRRPTLGDMTTAAG
jgi:hypothetical protein